MKQILENRFKILFLFFMYTDNEKMMDEIESITETYTKDILNALSVFALRKTVCAECSIEYLQDLASNEIDIRWWMLFALSCENKNDTFTDMLEGLRIKLYEKHPNAKKMLTYFENMAVDIFELKADLPAYQLN